VSQPESDSPSRPGERLERISAGAWSFLLVAAGLLVLSLLLVGASPDWLSSTSFNPEHLRVLPEPFQSNDFWRDSLPPLLLTGLLPSAAVGCQGGAGAMDWWSWCYW
jgi:hypothetical protein